MLKPLLPWLIYLCVLRITLSLRVPNKGLSLGSPIALVVELIRLWLLMLVALLRIKRHLGLIELLLRIVRIERLGSRIRNEGRDLMSGVLGH